MKSYCLKWASAAAKHFSSSHGLLWQNIWRRTITSLKHTDPALALHSAWSLSPGRAHCHCCSPSHTPQSWAKGLLELLWPHSAEGPKHSRTAPHYHYKEKKKSIFCDHLQMKTTKIHKCKCFPNPLEHLPVDFGTLSPTNGNCSGVTISDLTPGFWLIM